MSHADRRFGRRCARPLATMSVKLAATDRRPSPMPTSKPKSRAKKPPKRVLALPDLEQAKAAVLNSLTSASGQRTYDHAITEFVAWYCSEPRLAFNRTVVLRYRIHLEQRHYAPAMIWDVVKGGGQTRRHREAGPARSPAHVCSVVPPRWRGTRSDSVPAWTRLDPDDRAVLGLQAETPVRRQRHHGP